MYFILSKWDFYFTMIMIFKKFVSTCYCNLRQKMDINCHYLIWNTVKR